MAGSKRSYAIIAFVGDRSETFKVVPAVLQDARDKPDELERANKRLLKEDAVTVGV